MKALQTAGWALVLSVLAATAGWWMQQYLTGSKLVGQPLPEITINDLQGQPQSLSQYRGKLLLVNFWATWCAPCVDEIPMLVAAQKEYGARGLQIVGPAMDEVDAVKEMAARLGMDYPLMADSNAVDAALRALGNGAGGLPFTVLIGRDGTILKVVLGGLSQNELKSMIESHLATPATAS